MRELSSETFFRGTYRYPRTALVTGAILAFCGWWLWKVAGMLAREGMQWTWKGVGMIAFIVLIPGILGWANALIFYHALRKTEWEVVVDRFGCTDTMDRRTPFRPWADLKSVGLVLRGDRVYCWMDPRSRWASARILQTDPGMTIEEGEALLEIIVREVVPDHPHLKVMGRG